MPQLPCNMSHFWARLFANSRFHRRKCREMNEIYFVHRLTWCLYRISTSTTCIKIRLHHWLISWRKQKLCQVSVLSLKNHVKLEKQWQLPDRFRFCDACHWLIWISHWFRTCLRALHHFLLNSIWVEEQTTRTKATAMRSCYLPWTSDSCVVWGHTRDGMYGVSLFVAPVI